MSCMQCSNVCDVGMHAALAGINTFLFAVEDIGADICYELYGVVNHYGSLHGGHYTADVMHYTSRQWFTCSDSWYVLTLLMC